MGIRYTIIPFILLFALLSACTTSKWTVINEHAIDEEEDPEIISEIDILEIREYPTIESPIVTFAPYSLVEKEYTERVKIERFVQEYRPRWGFTTVALAGAAFAFSAANTGLILDSPTQTQKIGFNAAGSVLGILAFTNLRPVGDSIPSGETRFLRSSGTKVETDTVQVSAGEDENVFMEVTYKDEVIFADEDISFSDGVIELNVGSFANIINGDIDSDAVLEIGTEYRDRANLFTVPVNSFLEPYFEVEDPVVQVRSSASINPDNIIAELGEESSLRKLEDYDDDWVKVEYGSEDAFILRNSGTVQWRARTDSDSALLVELADLPFGEIDVENSLPILKQRNEADRAFIISNASGNQIGTRPFLDRSHQLYRHYMKTSLQMADEQIVDMSETNQQNWSDDLGSCGEMSSGNAIVFLTGYAASVIENGSRQLQMVYENIDGEHSGVILTDLIEQITNCSPEKLFVFADLEYVQIDDDLQQVSSRNGGSGTQQVVADRILRMMPNAVIIFGNTTSQQPSLYSGRLEDDKRHYLFPYFWAEALKQRKTQMSDLIRHLENNIDYTSRRLQDRPQEVRAFGNFTLNIGQ